MEPVTAHVMITLRDFGIQKVSPSKAHGPVMTSYECPSDWFSSATSSSMDLVRDQALSAERLALRSRSWWISAPVYASTIIHRVAQADPPQFRGSAPC